MGRLFWKFFLFIWLAQMAAVLGTSLLFWVERQPFVGHPSMPEAGPPPLEFPPHRPPPAGEAGPPDALGPAAGERPPGPPPPAHRRPGKLPLLPLLAGLVTSLLCAGGLAWYFAKPIRQLRQAFAAASRGELEVRVGGQMGGRRDELADLGHDFDRMTEHLGDLMSAQKRLLHDVSHEMRSPLARLQAVIGLVRQQPDRLDDSLQRLEREGERMNLLVGELLTLSRLEAGVAAPVEDIEMDELLGNIIDDARFEGEATQVGIDYVAGPPMTLRANPELLHRAIENVVRNALRFSPAGSAVRIEASQPAPGQFRLRIADQGPGVPTAELEKIFQPFYRGLAKSKGDGYGLGLAIARQVIATVNGKIEAKAKPAGQGLLVEIIIPS